MNDRYEILESLKPYTCRPDIVNEAIMAMKSKNEFFNFDTTIQIEVRKALQGIRQEIDRWHHLTDKAFNDGIDTALEIIDKHIKEFEG